MTPNPNRPALRAARRCRPPPEVYLHTNGPTLSSGLARAATAEPETAAPFWRTCSPAGPGHPGKPGHPKHSGQSVGCDLAKTLRIRLGSAVTVVSSDDPVRAVHRRPWRARSPPTSANSMPPGST